MNTAAWENVKLTTLKGNKFTKEYHYKRGITIAGGAFEFYGKVRFSGEKSFHFEGVGGTTTNRIIHAVHHPIDRFHAIAEDIADFGQVEEYRVYQRRGEGKAPRLLFTYHFNK